jgi:hypothetical protein
LVVIVSVAGLTAMVRFADAVCMGEPESVTLKVRDVFADGVVGVPLISPVDALSVKPAGNVPTIIDQVNGVVPPEAVSVCE